ncbi:olfactory receptor 52K1-like [Amia ocellicauda]|uniref:olfactory receptor 52K1-like n=1 Tax=Amia ocellicauda TaxID=2972642 RepID=UPI003463DD92|nr:O52K1 protein [Amia calva]
MQENPAGNISHTHFILIGFPGLYEYRRILSIPFFIMFVVAIVGNSVIIYTIKTGASLHSPMYILICALAIVDLTLPFVFIPEMLLSFLFDWNEISLKGCLVQMFFFHFLGSFESTILLIMALDRYVAICNPLRYNDYINMTTFHKLFVAAFIRVFFFITLIVILAGSLFFCLSNVIEHCFCEHMALVVLACGNTAKNSIVGLLGIFFIPGLDLLFILFSYCKIFSAVFKTSARKYHHKAIHTCGTHLIVIVVSYTFALCSFLVYRFRHSVTPDVHVLMSVMYGIFPSCLHPIIYGVRTKEIRDQILKTVKGSKTKVIFITIPSITQ